MLDALKMPIDYFGHAIVHSATMGGAVVGSQPDVELTKRNADLALYHAKEAGRGRFVMYEDGLGTSITRRLNAIRLVSVALQEDRIEPFYQPIVDLRSGEITALEALCRIVMDDGTIVPAGEFQEAVADVLVASELSQRMIARVAQHCRAWRQMNVSLRQVGILQVSIFEAADSASNSRAFSVRSGFRYRWWLSRSQSQSTSATVTR
jgi:predicted signal transduction protein with EAL and GGDEF domain